MSLPEFSTQAELFSTAGLSTSLFAPTDRYRLFGKVVYPCLAGARPSLEQCYCPENGRQAIEPVLLLGASILQFLDGVPDRQAVELLRYHAGWNFALNRQLGDEVFHPTSLANFRTRLDEHRLSTLGFTTVLNALVEAGLVSRQSRQRLDSTQMFGRVARMSRLDCVRETLRLALQELEGALTPEARPLFWVGLWERYVESQTDYRAGSEALARKLVQAGTDIWQLLEWTRQPAHSAWARGEHVQLLARVFGEQFEVRASQPAPVPKEKILLTTSDMPAAPGAPEPTQIPTSAAAVPIQTSNPSVPPKAQEPPAAVSQPVLAAPTLPGSAAQEGNPAAGRPAQEDQSAARSPAVEPKAKQELVSERVQNPHEPQATYAAKGQGEKKKEHVGYKVQVAETVCEAALAPGEPTRNFITGILTHPAYQSDEAGALQMEDQQAAMGLDKPPVQYADGAYISAEKLVEAHGWHSPGLFDSTDDSLLTAPGSLIQIALFLPLPTLHPLQGATSLKRQHFGA